MYICPGCMGDITSSCDADAVYKEWQKRYYALKDKHSSWSKSQLRKGIVVQFITDLNNSGCSDLVPIYEWVKTTGKSPTEYVLLSKIASTGGNPAVQKIVDKGTTTKVVDTDYADEEGSATQSTVDYLKGKVYSQDTAVTLLQPDTKSTKWQTIGLISAGGLVFIGLGIALIKKLKNRKRG